MKKERMNDKGFSLVELIIVIAIMAILIVVLAPQYLKYVEKSRLAADQTTIVEYINAMQVLASDPEVSLDSTKEYSIKSDSDGKIKVSDELKNLLVSQGMLDATAVANGKVQSTGYKAAAMDIQLKYEGNVWNVKAVSGKVDVSGKLQEPAPGGGG